MSCVLLSEIDISPKARKKQQEHAGQLMRERMDKEIAEACPLADNAWLSAIFLGQSSTQNWLHPEKCWEHLQVIQRISIYIYICEAIPFASWQPIPVS